MRQKRDNSNGITEGVIWKQLLIFFFPMLFGTFFQQLYTTMDAIVVGRCVGKAAMSAVGGSTSSLINVLIGFFMGLSTGATVTISQYYGAKNKEDVSKAVHTAIALAIVSGAFIMIIGIIGAPTALRLMGTNEDIMPYALTFIRIYFCGTIANLIYNMGSGILRAIGNSKLPLYFLIFSCVVNIILDILFVAVFHWGVMGVGLATVIAQFVSAILVCINLMRAKECYRLKLSLIRFHKGMLNRILRIGLPAGFQTLMYSSSNVIVQSNINGFGTNTVAAWTAYSKIDGIFWMTVNAFGISITTFSGQNFGAGKYERVRKGTKTCLKIALVVTLGLSALIYFVAPYIYLLFTKDPTVIEIGLKMARFLAPAFVTYFCIEILSGSLRGMGASFVPMIITVLGICVLRITWLFTAVPAWYDIKTVMFSYPLTWVTTSTLFIIYYRYYTKRHLKEELIV